MKRNLQVEIFVLYEINLFLFQLVSSSKLETRGYHRDPITTLTSLLILVFFALFTQFKYQNVNIFSYLGFLQCFVVILGSRSISCPIFPHECSSL